MNGPLTYVAGPYSGDVNANTRRAMDVMAQLMDADVPCVVPHLSHFADLVNPRPYEIWMALDLELIAVCARVLRLSGPSVGADREVRRAAELSIPVWFEDYGTVEEFIESLTLERVNTELEAWGYTELAAGVAARGTASSNRFGEDGESKPLSHDPCSREGDAESGGGRQEPGPLVITDLNPRHEELTLRSKPALDPPPWWTGP